MSLQTLAPLFLLQTGGGIKYFKDDDPLAGLILLIGIAVVVGLAFLFVLIRHILVKLGITPGRSSGSRHFSRFALRRAARQYRLAGDQLKLLETVFRSSGITNPEKALANTETLDRSFKHSYRLLKRSGAGKDNGEMDRELARLFSTRIAIESSPFALAAGNIPRITERSAAVLRMNGRSYNVTVLSSRNRQVTIDCPLNALGTPAPAPKGARVVISFFIDATRGIASSAEVLQMEWNAKGTPVLDLALVGKPENLIKRKSRRRHVNIPCEMQITIAVKSGGKTVMRVDPRKYSGVIQDISPGGCSIKMKGALKPGSRIKITFSHREGNVEVLGMILRINRGSSINSTIHLKFVKVPLPSMNVINATVFDFNES